MTENATLVAARTWSKLALKGTWPAHRKELAETPKCILTRSVFRAYQRTGSWANNKCGTWGRTSLADKQAAYEKRAGK